MFFAFAHGNSLIDRTTRFIIAVFAGVIALHYCECFAIEMRVKRVRYSYAKLKCQLWLREQRCRCLFCRLHEWRCPPVLPPYSPGNNTTRIRMMELSCKSNTAEEIMYYHSAIHSQVIFYAPICTVITWKKTPKNLEKCENSVVIDQVLHL